jgi:hypothetical protein
VRDLQKGKDMTKLILFSILAWAALATFPQQTTEAGRAVREWVASKVTRPNPRDINGEW